MNLRDLIFKALDKCWNSGEWHYHLQHLRYYEIAEYLQCEFNCFDDYDIDFMISYIYDWCDELDWK